jgi:Ca-activated chloride channel family protein
MMETITGRGNGNYHYVDQLQEARKVLVEEMTGTLVTIAKDVKIQIEFNPAKVAGYRLIGYENRLMQTQDFNDDKRDAGDIGAGHTVTALYEFIPAGKTTDVPPVEPLKYQSPPAPTDNASGELLALKMRYKEPDGTTSRKLEWAVTDSGGSFSEATTDFQFAASVAAFGMLLRDSQYVGDMKFDAILEIAASSVGEDAHRRRAEFLDLIRRAKELSAR